MSDIGKTESILGLEQLTGSVQKNIKWSKGLLSRLLKAENDAKAGRPLSALRKLIEVIQNEDDAPALPAKSAVLNELKQRQSTLSERGKGKIRDQLILLAREHGYDCKPHPDGIVIGSFLVAIDDVNERAEIQYAKVAISDSMPLSAEQLIGAINTYTKQLEEPVDLPEFQDRLEQAVRVRQARASRTTTSGQVRVELPQLFNELEAIAFLNPKRKAYHFLRFLVELKTYLQSDQNIKGTRNYRLEPAVIENSRNAAKSIFIPKDLKHGYGEATAFQALVLMI